MSVPPEPLFIDVEKRGGSERLLFCLFLTDRLKHLHRRQKLTPELKYSANARATPRMVNRTMMGTSTNASMIPVSLAAVWVSVSSVISLNETSW